jgi:hypothetical protein
VKTFLYILCVTLFSLHSYAINLFDYTSDAMEDMIGIYRPNNSAVFIQFKTQLSTIQKQIQQEIDSAKATKNLGSESVKKIKNLQEQQKKIVDSAEQQLDSHDFYILQKVAYSHQTIVDELLKDWDILADYWQKYSIPFLKQEENKNNPYKDKIAHVQQRNAISSDEKTFLSKRSPFIKKGFAQFFNDPTMEAPPFTLAYVGPGGGYRAMILTSGYLAGLEDLGLLDATSYIAALSGSTWFLVPWVFSGNTVRAFQNSLLEKINRKQLNPAQVIFDKTGYISSAYLENLVSVLWPKYVFNQNISSVDIYGSLLAEALLSNDQKKYHLADQWNYVKDGSKPFPLYTSVSPYTDDKGKQQYSWNEFNPLEMQNLDLNLSIPSYSLGSEFDKGASKEIAPQQALGYLMGTFGSAYLMDLIDIKKILTALQKEAGKKGSDKAAQYLIVATLINLINTLPLSISTLRVFPSLTFNPFKNYENKNIFTSFKNNNKLMFIDGATNYNIPGRPLLQPSRKVNAIIIGDTSGDVFTPNETPNELSKFFKDAKKVYGYTYTQVDDKKTPTLRLYKDLKNKQAPRIIYLNFVKDEALLKKGLQDPELKKIIDDGNLTAFDYGCVLGGYCAVYNFDYDVPGFKQLSKIAEFNVKANKGAIEKFLRDEFINVNSI